MKQIFGYVLLGWLAIERILNQDVDIIRIAYLLGALCIFIVKEKFFDGIYASFIYLGAMAAIAFYNPGFILLLGIPLLDFAYRKKYVTAVSIYTTSVIWSISLGSYPAVVILAAAGFIGYTVGIMKENDRKNLSVLDDERRLRYSLEQTQHELINSRKQIEHLTEIRERNRIAREIHDNISHSIAGVIFQLEAAARFVGKDAEKAEGILKICSAKLAAALELTRNTVYNIKADRKIGLESIEKMIGDFRYCPVEFEHRGDFNGLSATNLQILESCIMECLTNASKHSQAKKIQIKLDIGNTNIRFYYKDDGRGCSNIRENIGLSGMRDRVRNTGGTVSIDGSDGFLIVCNFPKEHEHKNEEGGSYA